ncbi:MAG: nreB [Fibrobacteria bacterium]|nr:nreB [Fibrobacteria bacterium]
MRAPARVPLREIAALKKKLEKETARREEAEAALKASKRHYDDLLALAQLAREQKRLLAHQVLLAQEEERRQISRTLHDEISQILTGINVRLVTLSKANWSDAPMFQKKISATRRMVENSVKIVHRFARELRPVLLDELGLIPALHTFMKTLTRQTGLHIQFTAFAEVEKLGNDKRTALFRVVQSALNNVARHAQATQVLVKIEKRPQGLDLVVHDNGKSFQVERVLLSKRFKRLGLLSMRERVEMFGGSLEVESAPGKGTLVHATLPFDKTKD